MSNFQLSSCFEGKLKNLEGVLLHYSIHLGQCISITGSKTALEHDAITTMLYSCYIVLWFECLTIKKFPISIALEGVSYGAGASFLVGTFSVHC